ncbi:uncharacterized protein LOC128234067 [Mya arenaria]|uniref:uncharacterized protein LOC128234067 n=1 Tax=Mya arenaria TaxID=6604 RepID=UPI0022E2D720|nr:uncharacterized protein LOC128234067 [Mya arenaria]
MQEYMDISWYTYENDSLQQLPLVTDEYFIKPVNSTYDCPNATCICYQAKKYSYGLEFTRQTGQYVYSVVEIHIVHSLFEDEPLIWKSSKTYPVKVLAESASDEPGRFKKNIVCAFIGCVAAVLIIGLVLFIRSEEKKQEKRTVVSRLPLFSSFNDNEKRSIADAMDFKHMVRNATTSVDMLCKLHVITNGELYVTERGKTFGNSCAVVNAFKLSMRPTSDVTKVLPILREETRRKYNIHMLPTNTNFSATDEIKLLVMGLEQYNNILMSNKNWKSILNGEDPPAATKERETSDPALTRAKGPPESIPPNDENDLIIIEIQGQADNVTPIELVNKANDAEFSISNETEGVKPKKGNTDRKRGNRKRERRSGRQKGDNKDTESKPRPIGDSGRGVNKESMANPTKSQETETPTKTKATGNPSKSHETEKPSKSKKTGSPCISLETGNLTNSQETGSILTSHETVNPTTSQDNGNIGKSLKTESPTRSKKTRNPTKYNNTENSSKIQEIENPTKGQDTGNPIKSLNGGNQEPGDSISSQEPGYRTSCEEPGDRNPYQGPGDWKSCLEPGYRKHFTESADSQPYPEPGDRTSYEDSVNWRPFQEPEDRKPYIKPDDGTLCQEQEDGKAYQVKK